MAEILFSIGKSDRLKSGINLDYGDRPNSFLAVKDASRRSLALRDRIRYEEVWLNIKSLLKVKSKQKSRLIIKMLVKNIEIPIDQITKFCQRWKVKELALFGSVLREDFRPDSDLDILISFAPDNCWTLLDRVDMQDELTEIFGRKVDLVNKQGIERSRNYLRKDSILSSAKVIYEITGS